MGSYFISKIIMEQLTFIILPFTYITIVYWMANLNNDADKFFICAVTIVFVANIAVSFGNLYYFNLIFIIK